MIKKQETKTKFNIGDALIVLLALVCLTTIIYRAFVIKVVSDDEYTSYTITYSIDARELSFATEYMHNGDLVEIFVEDEFVALGNFKGDVAKTLLTEYTDTAVDEKNDYLMYGEISVKGTLISTNQLKLENGVVISVGEGYLFKSPIVQGKLGIVSIVNDYKK